MNVGKLRRVTAALGKWSLICVLALIWVVSAPLGWAGNGAASWAAYRIAALRGEA